MARFEYRGGVIKPNEHQSEKFLLFFLVGDEEVMFHQMLQDGLAVRVKAGKDEFTTPYEVAKVFVSQQGFGIEKRFHSFYLKFDDGSPTIEIFPYSGKDKYVPLYFKGKCHLMDKKEVMEVLPEGSTSSRFFSKQETLALDLQDRMVRVDKSNIKEGIRVVRIGLGKQKNKSRR